MLVGAFFFTQTSINYTNNDKKRDISFKNYRPKSSGTMINITTPKNKTYVKPMTGYYPATYGFENDKDWSNPSNFITQEPGGTIQVIPEIGGHKKVLEFYDDTIGASVWINTTFNDQTTGTIGILS